LILSVLALAAILAWLRFPLTALWVPAALFVFPFVYAWIAAPVIIKRRNWCAADPTLQAFDPNSADTPVEAAESLQAVVPALEALGFRNLGHFRASETVPHTRAYVTLFEDRPARQTARLMTTIAEIRGRRQVETVLAFFTEFTDGTSLVTSNNVTRRLVPLVGFREGSMAFPEVRDPRRLYEIHQASVARFASDAIRLEPQTRDPVEFLRQSVRRETAKLAETGYYAFDEESQIYRPTWKGALLMGWKSVIPIKPIREMLRRRRAARLLHELGFA
jgi:hypothetical protein